MKPFTDKATCPKCQSKLGAGIDPACGDRHYTLTYCDDSMHTPSEHLHVRCASCGYEWLMECADAATGNSEITWRSNEPIIQRHPNDHRRSRIAYCNTEKDCADAEPSDDKDPSHEIVCPACDAVLLLLSKDLDPVHVAYCKLKDLEGDYVITCPHCARVTYRSVVDDQDDASCTCGASVGSGWHFEDCPLYRRAMQEVKE